MRRGAAGAQGRSRQGPGPSRPGGCWTPSGAAVPMEAGRGRRGVPGPSAIAGVGNLGGRVAAAGGPVDRLGRPRTEPIVGAGDRVPRAVREGGRRGRRATGTSGGGSPRRGGSPARQDLAEAGVQPGRAGQVAGRRRRDGEAVGHPHAPGVSPRYIPRSDAYLHPTVAMSPIPIVPNGRMSADRTSPRAMTGLPPRFDGSRSSATGCGRPGRRPGSHVRTRGGSSPHTRTH
jgi:hypothetical protein